MSDPASGMAALNQRVARARRAAPPPRLPRPADSTPPEPEAPASNPNPAATTTLSPPPNRVRRATPSPASPAAATSADSAENPQPPRAADRPAPASRSEELLDALSTASSNVTLGARVRQPLDQLLTDIVYETRQHGVRTTKVELIEMALAWLATLDRDAVADTVLEFRTRTTRASR